MGRSRPNYPETNLNVLINDKIILDETLSHTWREYTIIFIITKSDPLISNIKFANTIITSGDYTAQISCVELTEL
jgi:hypothetical protein